MCNPTLGIGIDPYIELATLLHRIQTAATRQNGAYGMFLEDYFLPLVPLNMIR
jgi:hypothetical protein